MTKPFVIDVAGGAHGGAARFAGELHRYLAQNKRDDVRVLGAGQRVTVGWLNRREIAARGGARKIALNNVSFLAHGGHRWTLLRNVLHFLTEQEAQEFGRSVPPSVHVQGAAVRLAARRSDVLVVPCNAMADRVAQAVPTLGDRLIVRPHPVSPTSISTTAIRKPEILCPVIFHPYKRMVQRITDFVRALDRYGDPDIQLHITADRHQLTPFLAEHRKVFPIGVLSYADLRAWWARSRAIYYPTEFEAFGYPLAEARVSGHPIIAVDSAQNREIAEAALCGFTPEDADSLLDAVACAMTRRIEPDLETFDPTAYFSWLLDPK